MAAREARAAGIHWTFAPMVDIARDPRWGRIMEGAGEDPFLGSRMADAQVRGFQGATPRRTRPHPRLRQALRRLRRRRRRPRLRRSPTSPTSSSGTSTCRPSTPPRGRRRHLHVRLHGPQRRPRHRQPLAPARRPARPTGASRASSSATGSAVKSLATHGFAADPADAAVRAVNAGVDMEMTSTTFRDTSPAAVKSGAVTEATIDDAVRPILEAKYNLGLFAQPYIDPAQPPRRLSLADAAHRGPRSPPQRTAVLLRNEGHTAAAQQAATNPSPSSARSPTPSPTSWAPGASPATPPTPSPSSRAFARRFGADAHPLRHGRRDRARPAIHLRRAVLQRPSPP